LARLQDLANHDVVDGAGRDTRALQRPSDRRSA
jgi:hypothetical protein